MNLDTSKAVVILGVLLALGMSAAAFIFGIQAKQIGAGKQTIAVKGLAEKPVTADYAEWSISLHVQGASFAEALAKLRKERPTVDTFLVGQGFSKDAIGDGNESVTANMVDEPIAGGGTRTVQRGFNAAQDILVTAKDLARASMLRTGRCCNSRAKGIPCKIPIRSTWFRTWRRSRCP